MQSVAFAEDAAGYIGAEIADGERGVIVTRTICRDLKNGDRIEKIDGQPATAKSIAALKPGQEVRIELRHQVKPDKWGLPKKLKRIVTTREESLLAASQEIKDVSGNYRAVSGDRIELRLKDELQLIITADAVSVDEVQIGEEIVPALDVRGSSGKAVGVVINDNLRAPLADAKTIRLHTLKNESIDLNLTETDSTAIFVAMELSKLRP